MKTIYVNCRWSGMPVETVDEFPFNTRDEKKEARRCLAEYRMSDNTGNYYLSQRCTNDWKNK